MGCNILATRSNASGVVQMIGKGPILFVCAFQITSFGWGQDSF